ncbi:hypothetical protein AXF42_Ash001181 [Apostasia shenzhenica]|uniref:DUF4218 domain-containing protein n=1 Tax=Apostasia shenzhenica TaxID=1088818 RepID=A0A2I0AU69_9ASPA|nr:hypothetical protein AXF42_Ash001181 [Apostasia shenzhenica]
MYPFEGYMFVLKNMIHNKARPEGSICETYLIDEVSTFCSHYFEPNVPTKHNKAPHNNDEDSEVEERLSIFKQERPFSLNDNPYYCTDEEYNAAHLYILLNYPEVGPYIE